MMDVIHILVGCYSVVIGYWYMYLHFCTGHQFTLNSFILIGYSPVQIQVLSMHDLLFTGSFQKDFNPKFMISAIKLVHMCQ